MGDSSRRRTRYRIGAGGVVYVAFAALLLGAATYMQANLLFWSLGLMVGGLVVSVLLSWQVMRRIEVTRMMPSHGVVGEPLVLRYHIRNRSWLPIFGLLVQETWGKGLRGWRKIGPVSSSGPGGPTLGGQPVGWMLHLGPHQSAQAEAPCWPMIRGPLAFEQIVISSAFPFNVIRKVLVFRQDQEVLVYPALYRINRRLIASLSRLDLWGQHQLDRGGGHEEFFGLREYRQGDRMSTIDWKHSASHGELISREMTHPSPPRVMLLVDLSPSRTRAAQHAAGETDSVGGNRSLFRPFGRSTKPNAAGPGSASSAAASDSLANSASASEARSQTNTDSANACPIVDPAPSDLPAWLVSEERAIGLAASMICDAHLSGFQVGLALNGLNSPLFTPHHSLPHRTRMLEALARLQLDPEGEQSPDHQSAPVEPTVIITTDQPETGQTTPELGPTASRAGPTVLYADHLAQYVVNADRDDLLSRHARRPTRRERLDVGPAAAK